MTPLRPALEDVNLEVLRSQTAAGQIGAAVSFLENIDSARAFLERNGRVSLTVLRREFELDDRAFDELVEELVDVQQVAAREGKVLSWIGVARAEASASKPKTRVAPEASSEPAVTRPSAEAERRQLTVMFCDLVGSTNLSQRLDAEDWRNVVRAYQESASEVIERNAGHIAQYLGDGLLVYFGYPRAHEDDAEHAVRAGREILAALGAVNDALERQHGVRLAVRVGIHTGSVVVGEMGGGAKSETLALGDTPNIAARLQRVAEPDTVVISGATLRLVPGLFVTNDLGTPALKGVEAPIRAHAVLQETGLRSRLDVDPSRLTPLVGRDRERGLLLECWEHVQEGEGQAVLLSGEAGLGKSRLILSFREQLNETPHGWLECRCSPYTQGSAFHPVVELVEQGLGFMEGDDLGAKLTRLEEGIGSAGLSAPDVVPLLAPLLSLRLPDCYQPLELSPDLQRKKTIESVVAWILGLVGSPPLVLLVEDLHWCDASTVELLGCLLEQSPTAKVLILLSFRPDFEPPWPARSHLTSVAVKRLSRRQAKNLIGGMTRDVPLPVVVVERVVERADGVPLFLEELTKMVLESGLVEEREGRYELTAPIAELAIPATLQDSLMARLDRLSAAKGVAQVASALGREFPYLLLASVAEQDESTLCGGLARLVEAELLFQRGTPPSATYTFKHALIQDTAYESLLRSARERLHGRTAEVLEAEFPERAVGEPELVAHHYDRAGRWTEAISYYLRAADAAHARCAFLEAIAHLERGIELTRGLPEGAERDDPDLRLHVSLGLARAAAHGTASEDTGRAWERARLLCKGVRSPAQLAMALNGLALFHENRSELDAAMQFGDQLLALGRSLKDESYVLAGTLRVGVAKYFQGNFRECLDDHNAALTIYDHKEPKGGAGLISASNNGVEACLYASSALWTLGYPDQANARAEEGLARARTLGPSISLALALFWASICRSLRAEWTIAARLSEECAEESERRGSANLIALSGILRAHAVAQSHGSDVLAEAMERIRGTGTGQRAGVPFFLSLIARIHQKLGREADALSAVESGLAASARGRQPAFDADLLQLKGELLLSSDPAEAETFFLRAIEVAQHQEAKSTELRVATSLSRLWHHEGKQVEARILLATVYSWFTEGFDTQDLKAAKALLDELT